MVYCPKCGKSMVSYVEHDCVVKTWECFNCNDTNPMGESCKCGMALEDDDPNELLYELDEVMNKVEVLSLKAKSLMKKMRIQNNRR